jgi:hypothetical protein
VRAAERDIAMAARSVPDERARHYWDGTGALMRALRRTLDIDEDAWDVFLLYGPEAHWDGRQPPPPLFWMHQLGSPEQPRVDGPYFDAEAFAQRARAVLRATDD